MAYCSIELCAGAGGQALGLEKAGFQHYELIEIDHNACNTLRFNRPHWNVIEFVTGAPKATRETLSVLLCPSSTACPGFTKKQASGARHTRTHSRIRWRFVRKGLKGCVAATPAGLSFSEGAAA
jgi:site-specific DNA-cytosine methylase